MQKQKRRPGVLNLTIESPLICLLPEHVKLSHSGWLNVHLHPTSSHQLNTTLPYHSRIAAYYNKPTFHLFSPPNKHHSLHTTTPTIHHA